MRYILQIHDDDVAKFESYFGGAVEVIPSQRRLEDRDVQVTGIDKADPPFRYTASDSTRTTITLYDLAVLRNLAGLATWADLSVSEIEVMDRAKATLHDSRFGRW